ncbi:hypothetical protein [Sphingomonas phage Carli]|nr:hypothetical protein [Sphingomonas phage Carli]
MATDRNTLARSADQRAVHAPMAVTIHDKGHLPFWRRGRGHRHSGEITFKVTHENGLPVLTVRTVEHSGPESREVQFEVFGSAAFEVLEVVREIEGRASMQPKGGL